MSRKTTIAIEIIPTGTLTVIPIVLPLWFGGLGVSVGFDVLVEMIVDTILDDIVIGLLLAVATESAEVDPMTVAVVPIESIPNVEFVQQLLGKLSLDAQQNCPCGQETITT